MSTRPQYEPQFASLDVNLPGTGNSNKFRPPVEIRETGYDYLQKPPAEEFNWIINNLAQWVAYLDDYTRSQADAGASSKSQAEAGIDNQTWMSPLRVLQSIQANAVPTGTIQFFAGQTAPSGWKVCNGETLLIDTYADLYAVIGHTHGGGGTTTFMLPDLRDDFVRGSDGLSRPVGTRESDAFKGHSHTGTTDGDGAHTHTVKEGSRIQGSAGLTSGDDYTHNAAYLQTTSSAGFHAHTFTTNDTGGSETRPRNVALLPIIKI